MEHVIAWLEWLVRTGAHLGIIVSELAGIMVLIITAGKAVAAYFRRDTRIRLHLAQGIALALEFKLGSEVLRTVVARDWTELGILGAVIALRGVLTLLLHWEIRIEEAHERLSLPGMEKLPKNE